MQKAIKKEVRLIKIRPNIVGDIMVDLDVSIIGKEVDFSNDDLTMLDEYYKHIGCDCIDITSFGGIYNPKGYSVVVDDEGLLKSGNLVMAYTLPIEGENITLELAGTILIGKSDYVENKDFDGLYEVGLSDSDIEYIKEHLSVRLLGLTR